MIKAPVNLQELRRKIYVKAKTESQWRFWGLYVHICKLEVLQEAYRLAKSNKGAPGLDGVTFEEIEASGTEMYLQSLQEELQSHAYKPGKARKVKIPKADGKSFRELSIPTIRDRIVQGAVKLILEPIFEADFKDGSFGYRPKRSASDAIQHVSEAILQKKTKVIDLDISKFFDTVKQDVLLRKIATRVEDKDLLHLVKVILKASSRKGLPQGGPLSPLLSNIYLNSVDEILERLKQTTMSNGYYNLDYARWADDAVILIDQFKPRPGLIKVVTERLREEFSRLGLKLNEEKTITVDLTRDESFGFLGFDFRLSKTKSGKTGVMKTPKRQARVKLQQTIKGIFRAKRGRPVKEVVEQINPVLRGWANYFRIGNSKECFDSVRYWVEKKVRRHIYRNKKKRGFGWKRWSSQQIHLYTGLYDDYQIRYSR
jgi:RNA-directed DNA polymerase